MSDDIAQIRERKGALAAVGGVLGAVVASSCCIGPLVLVTLGVSGAWIGNLTALKDYQPLFIAVTLAFLGVGFWQVYRRRHVACEAGSCEKALSSIVAKSALWMATVLVALALTVEAWAPLFY